MTIMTTKVYPNYSRNQVSHETWSPMYSNSSSLNKANCRPIWVKTKNKDFMKMTSFHENCWFPYENHWFSWKPPIFIWKSPDFKTKDHLQGIVTPMFITVEANVKSGHRVCMHRDTCTSLPVIFVQRTDSTRIENVFKTIRKLTIFSATFYKSIHEICKA